MISIVGIPRETAAREEQEKLRRYAEQMETEAAKKRSTLMVQSTMSDRRATMRHYFTACMER